MSRSKGGLFARIQQAIRGRGRSKSSRYQRRQFLRLEPLETRAVLTVPVAVGDGYSLAEDTILSVDADSGVLVNDSDADSDLLTAELVSDATNGTLTLNPDGSFDYDPIDDFVGSDSFTYRVLANGDVSNTVTVTLDVTAVNDAPVAVDDPYSVAPNGTLTVSAALGVLANDSDVDDLESVLTATQVGTAANGTVTLNSDGSFTFTPTPGYSGIASFKYTAVDDDNVNAISNEATVTITVNAPPTVTDVADQTTIEGAAPLSVPFTVGDDQTDPAVLGITTASSNQTLIPNASVVLGGSGANRTLTITPAAGEIGTATITITVTDANNVTSTDTFLVTVNANGDPTISDVLNQNVQENETLDTSVVIGDAETAANNLHITASSSDTTLIPDASIVIGTTGGTRTIAITPTPGLTGTATITLTVTDENGGTATDTFVVTVNEAPTIANVPNQNVQKNGSLNTSVVISDAETPVDSLVVAASSSDTALIPDASIVVGTTGGTRTIAITPTPGQIGTATITLTLSDQNGGIVTETFVVTVNEAPTIGDVPNQNVQENGTLNTSVVISDAETPVDSLVVAASSSDTGLIPDASIVVSTTGGTRTIAITPTPGQTGTATITLTLSDQNGGMVTETFVVTVNEAPTIGDVPNQNVQVNGTLNTSVVIDDEETEDDDLEVTAESSDTNLIPNANIVISQAGGTRTIVITPAQGQTGSATITLTVTDENGGTATDSFLVTVSANAPPTISPVADLSTNEDTATGNITVTIADPDTPVANLNLTAASSDTTLVPTSGIAITGTGGSRTIVITPAANRSGMTTITLTLDDGSGGTTTETFVLTVNAVNDLPTATNDTYTTTEDTALNITAPASGVLANDTDPENEALTTVLVLAPSSGQLVLNTNGTFTYTPALNFTGAVTFQYRAQDASGGQSGIATVTINVTGTSDAPTATADAYTVNTGNTLTVNATNGVLANDTDPDSGTTLTAVLGTTTANGTLSLAANGSFTYTPNAGFSGTDSFTYRASDGAQQSSLVTVTIAVSAINAGAPILSGPSSGVRGQTLTYNLSVIGGTSTNVSYAIDWNGDGTNDQTVTGPGSGTTVTHVFATSGSFNVRLQTGSPAQSTTLPVTITDTLRVGSTFVVGGTSGNDSIVVQKVGKAGIRVLVNGTAVGGVQTGVRMVEVSGGDGNDNIVMPASVNASAVFRGGAGNDRLVGGKLADFLFGDAGNDLLSGGLGSDFTSGGAGDDSLAGGTGHDVLFGGDGVDSLVGGSHNNLMLGGTTDFDDNFAAQKAILHAWVAGGTFEQRMNRLNSNSKGGLKLIQNDTVNSDGEADRVVSNGSRDWVFAAIADADQVSGKRKGRIVSFA